MKKIIDSRQELGMRIRYLRQSKGLTIEALSFEAGLNRNYLSDMERGKRNPTVLVLQKVAKALDITLETLFKGIN